MARTNEGGRLAYAELLRVVAMLAVIVLHVSGGWLESLPVGTTDWHALNMWDSLCRWCVPVFVMCSGMFLLDPKRRSPGPPSSSATSCGWSRPCSSGAPLTACSMSLPPGL